MTSLAFCDSRMRTTTIRGADAEAVPAVTLDVESSHVAIRDAVSQAGRGPSRPGSSTPAVSARMHAPRGSLPPVRLDRGTEPAVPLVGSPVTWTATASGHGATPVYQFSVGPTGGPSHVVRDFSPSNSFTWDPMQEGSYDIQVTVKDSFSAATGESATASYTADSRVAGADAVISPTSNPLVALYSAPLLRQFDVRSVQTDWARTSPGVRPPRCPSCRGRAPTSSSRACCRTRPIS